MSKVFDRVALRVLSSREDCLQRAKDVEYESLVGAVKTKLDFDDMFRGVEPRIEDDEAREIIAAYHRADVGFHEIVVQLQANKLKEMKL